MTSQQKEGNSIDKEDENLTGRFFNPNVKIKDFSDNNENIKTVKEWINEIEINKNELLIKAKAIMEGIIKNQENGENAEAKYMMTYKQVCSSLEIPTSELGKDVFFLFKNKEENIVKKRTLKKYKSNVKDEGQNDGEVDIRKIIMAMACLLFPSKSELLQFE